MINLATHSSVLKLNKGASRAVPRLRHVRDLVPLEPVEHPSPRKLDSTSEFLRLTLVQLPGVDLGIIVRLIVGPLSRDSSSRPDVSARRWRGCRPR